MRLTKICRDTHPTTTEYRYTAWNELLELDSPDTGTTTRQLDTAGNITQHTNANNQQTVYRYDAQNRLSEVDYQGDDLDVALSYDQGSYGQGRLTAVIDGSGSRNYQYDDRGLITQANTTIAGVSLNTAYQYNDANQLIQISYPNGGDVQYSYDVAGRLSAVQRVDNTTTTAIISNISWHGPTVNKYQQGNGVETQWTYDAAGRLIGKQFDSASNQFQQQLDNQGQITQQVWARAGSDRAENFEYDLLGRLNSDGSADATLSQLFSYDSVGNRLSQQLDTDTTNYNYEANSNRQSAINTTTIQLDAAGNTLNDGARAYQYDAMNRLAQINYVQTGAQGIYTYNYLGQRVRKQRSGDQTSDTRYIYGLQGELLGEYSFTGQRIVEYIYHNANGTYELVAQVNAAGDITYVHTDHLGTPRLATDADKTVVWRWLSDAFGVGSAQEDPDGDNEVTLINHRFAGQYFDAESGLHYNYFRYYDPKIGRYLRSDPIGIAGGINTYAYVYNNPLRYTDPFGLEAWVNASPNAQGGLNFTAHDNQGGPAITGNFNNDTTNFNQVEPGVYNVTPRPTLPNTPTNWLFDRNANAGNPTISNTDDWNTIRYSDGSITTGAQFHEGRNGTSSGTSLACMVSDRGTNDALNEMFNRNYGDGGVTLTIFPSGWAGP